MEPPSLNTAPAVPPPLQAILKEVLARELCTSPQEIDGARPLLHYGLDSLAALAVANELEERLGLRLPATLLWECPSLDQLARRLEAMLRERAPLPTAR